MVGNQSNIKSFSSFIILTAINFRVIMDTHTHIYTGDSQWGTIEIEDAMGLIVGRYC